VPQRVARHTRLRVSVRGNAPSLHQYCSSYVITTHICVLTTGGEEERIAKVGQGNADTVSVIIKCLLLDVDLTRH
jgi:hypothetical protein